MTINEINESVNGAKDWAKHYLGLEKKMRYKIRVNSKYGNRDYEGDNSQDNALAQFCNVLDDAIKDSRTTTIEIEFTDWKKTEKQTFPTIIMQNDIIMPGEKEEPKQEPSNPQGNLFNSTLIEFLGMANGIQGLGQVNSEAGLGGVLISATQQTMKREFEKQRQDEKIGAMQEEIRALKAKVAELESENKKLTKKCAELEEENEELADAQEQLDKLQSKHEKIAAVGGMMLGNIVDQLVAKSPLAGFLGLTETPQIPQQQMQPQQQTQQEETPTVIQRDDEDDDDEFIPHPIQRV